MCVDLSCKYVDNNQQIPMHQKMYIWRFTKIRDFPNHPFLDGIFHELKHPFWGTPMTMETPYIPIINHNITIINHIIPLLSIQLLGTPISGFSSCSTCSARACGFHVAGTGAGAGACSDPGGVKVSYLKPYGLGTYYIRLYINMHYYYLYAHDIT